MKILSINSCQVYNLNQNNKKQNANFAGNKQLPRSPKISVFSLLRMLWNSRFGKGPHALRPATGNLSLPPRGAIRHEFDLEPPKKSKRKK